MRRRARYVELVGEIVGSSRRADAPLGEEEHGPRGRPAGRPETPPRAEGSPGPPSGSPVSPTAHQA